MNKIMCHVNYSHLTLNGTCHEENKEDSYQLANTELNDLRVIICLRKSEVIVERISVCKVIENVAEHGIHCLPCSYTNGIIDMLP